ncbi:hypothetical protein AB0L00_23395 [Actinoallomurus sp. NPDC052308]|uniref:hypothetical protein n=1 Tax=Actinoallomurus sp. NPDC052308 TaxID=3155530 RepID=UPI003420E6CA
MLAPALCTHLVRLVRAGDHAEADRRQRDVDRLTDLFGVRPGAGGIVVRQAPR